jgi:hypothetical protein
MLLRLNYLLYWCLCLSYLLLFLFLFLLGPYILLYYLLSLSIIIQTHLTLFYINTYFTIIYTYLTIIYTYFTLFYIVY